MIDEEKVVKVGKGINIAHLNIRSIMGGHKFEMVRNQVEGSNIDVFTLSESWLTDAVPDRVVECMNYSIVRLDRKWKDVDGRGSLPKRGGGLANFIKNSIKYSDTKYEELNVSCKDVEMLWVALEIDNLRPIVVVTIFRPRQGDSKRCNSIINNAFERANLKDNAEVFMVGDFNVNFSYKQAIKTKELDFMAKLLGLKQVIKSSTRTSFRDEIKLESQLDLIFTNSDHVAEAKTLNYNISDHMAVLVTSLRKKRVPVKEKTEFLGRSYKNYVKEDFQGALKDQSRPFY